MTDVLKPLADAATTDAATDIAVGTAAVVPVDADGPDVIPEGVRVPGYIVQYGVGIPVGVWVGALATSALLLVGIEGYLPAEVVGFLSIGVFPVVGVLTTKTVVRRLRAFQERRLLQANDVDRRPRQLRAAGGSESPVAVRD